MNESWGNELEKEVDKKVLLADLGLLLVALFWGGGFVATKFALVDMTPLAVIAYRYAGAALITLPFCFTKLKKMNKKTVKAGIIIGILVFTGNTVQTIGLQYTTPGKQSFIIALYTVIVPLMTWGILKAKPSKNIFMASALALVGIGLLTLNENLTIGFGDGLTFVFAITFSAQIVFISVYMGELDALSVTFIQLLTTAILASSTAFLVEGNLVLGHLTQPSIVALIYLTTLNTAGAFLLQNICQRIAPANHTAIILSFETVFGTIFAVWLAGEIFTGRMMIGGLMMFTAIIVSKLRKKRVQRELCELNERH